MSWRTFRALAFSLFNLAIIAYLVIDFAVAYKQPTATAEESNSQAISRPEYDDQKLKIIAEQINKTRTNAGLQPLTQNQELDYIAELRAQDMAENAYYSHKGSDGRFFNDIMTAKGYADFKFACENLNMSEAMNPDRFVESWLASPAHKDCLMDSRVKNAGYAVTKVQLSNGIPVNQYVVVAIYSVN